MGHWVCHLAFTIALAVQLWKEARDLPAGPQTHVRWPLRPFYAPAFRWAALIFGQLVWLVEVLSWRAPEGSFWPHVWAGG